MIKLKENRANFYIFLAGALIFVPFLGGVHLFDWDEINFAESAREMIVTGNFLDVQINYHPFWEKPPLFIWIQVLSMKVFGINEFAARFPNAVCGIATMLVLFNTGKKFRDEKFGWIWLMTYVCSLLPFLYFKSGIIDPWFNLFIFLGIINFIYYLTGIQYQKRNLILSGFFLGLALLTKGPVALLVFVLGFIIYLFFIRFRLKTSFQDVLLFIVVLSITGGFWFILQILSGNMGVIQDFIVYQMRLFSTKDAGHGGFIGYHFVILFFGVFPASVFAIPALFRKAEDADGNAGFVLWMQILFFLVLVLFSIVKTKIVHYSSLCYFPISFLASVTIWKIFSGEIFPGRWLQYLLGFVSFVLGFIVVAISLLDTYKGVVISTGLLKDGFAIGNLQASGQWTGFETAIGIFFLLVSCWFICRLRKDPSRSIKGIFATSLLFSLLVIMFFTPRIESYSQRAAIEFYKSVSEEDAYITTLGFKSYAHLFYGKIKPSENNSVYEKTWLLNGKIDKRTYIVFKTNRKTRYLNEYPWLEILYEKNGFIFAKREPDER